MDSDSLAARIMSYADNRTLVAEHGELAVAFASNFTPSAYRRNIQTLLRDVLASR